jgi:hypothetical protein
LKYAYSKTDQSSHAFIIDPNFSINLTFAGIEAGNLNEFAYDTIESKFEYTNTFSLEYSFSDVYLVPSISFEHEFVKAPKEAAASSITLGGFVSPFSKATFGVNYIFDTIENIHSVLSIVRLNN